MKSKCLMYLSKAYSNVMSRSVSIIVYFNNLPEINICIYLFCNYDEINIIFFYR